MKKPHKGFIFLALDDYNHDGGNVVHEITAEEWERLIAPALKKGWPIDSGTVDEGLLEEVTKRRSINVSLQEFEEIDARIPLV